MLVDREEAGKLLAKKLEQYRSSDAVVLALPRGGVVLGYEIARALQLPLDIIPVRKIGHPYSKEVAVGAVNEDGKVIFDDVMVENVDKQWLKKAIEREKAESARRARTYRKGAPVAIAGKTAIIVDDGIATGLTMKLAVMVANAQDPKKIVVAVPVASREAMEALEKIGATVVLLEPHEKFLGAVGAHYVNFDQVEDDEVIRLLNTA